MENDKNRRKSTETSSSTIRSKSTVNSLHRDIPPGLGVTREKQACTYSAVLTLGEDGEELPLPGAFNVIWKCPDPDLGEKNLFCFVIN